MLNSSINSSVFKTDLCLEVSAIRKKTLPHRIQDIFVDLISLNPHSFLIYSETVSMVCQSVVENHRARPNINSVKTNFILSCSAGITETQIYTSKLYTVV